MTRHDSRAERSEALFAAIYSLVKQIPSGQVATYGQIAFVVGAATPRLVGHAMAVLPKGRDVPWYRVINSQGKVSARRDGGPDVRQRRLLEAEGVLFDRRDRVDFSIVGWEGPPWWWLEDHGIDILELGWRSRQIPRRGQWQRWAL